MSPEYAWRNREGRLARFEGKRIGGTVAVHFIKKNMWYLETALALLEGDDHSEAEKYERNRHLEMERERQKNVMGSTDYQDDNDVDEATEPIRKRTEDEEAVFRYDAKRKVQREF